MKLMKLVESNEKLFRTHQALQFDIFLNGSCCNKETSVLVKYGQWLIATVNSFKILKNRQNLLQNF